MPKFFVNREQIIDNKIKIIGQDVNHIKNVLRLEKNDNIVISIKENSDTYNCKIEEIKPEFIMCCIIDKNLDTTETKTYIHIFLHCIGIVPRFRFQLCLHFIPA